MISGHETAVAPGGMAGGDAPASKSSFAAASSSWSPSPDFRGFHDLNQVGALIRIYEIILNMMGLLQGSGSGAAGEHRKDGVGALSEVMGPDLSASVGVSTNTDDREAGRDRRAAQAAHIC